MKSEEGEQGQRWKHEPFFGVIQGREGDDDRGTNRKRQREVSEGSFSLYYKTHLMSIECVSTVSNHTYTDHHRFIHFVQSTDSLIEHEPAQNSGQAIQNIRRPTKRKGSRYAAPAATTEEPSFHID